METPHRPTEPTTPPIKPIRTASGVAPIAVVTKPWRCSSNCLYCPNDVRMPKSYLSDEPACQRAERNYFDPYLQVVSRLRALTQMGHNTDKIELIILGGSWSDYPPEYQIWFVAELFRALNDAQHAERRAKIRRKLYKNAGLSNVPQQRGECVHDVQLAVTSGDLSYNEAVHRLYETDETWQALARGQVEDMDALLREQKLNETAERRVVGMTVETRPDTVTPESLTLLRRLGCTRVQIGVQSLDRHVLRLNNRAATPELIAEVFALLRLFGFKIHAHIMQNLYGSTIEADEEDYLRLVTDPAYLPDEIKLYPCSLVDGTDLLAHYRDGSWQPYTEEQLIRLLATDVLNTPPYMRISRMIRDISAHDIMAGSKRTNLRQMVERHIELAGRAADIRDIRYREINTGEVNLADLTLDSIVYETSVSTEHFLQWVTPEYRIAGFLRLSLPKQGIGDGFVGAHSYAPATTGMPLRPNEAMIREVHVYGTAARLSETGKGVQHLGLGRQLIETAANIARQQGYTKLKVISSVGTREYYRKLGFTDTELYQELIL